MRPIIKMQPDRAQSGFSYIELMAATVLLVLAAVPAIDALRIGFLTAEVGDVELREFYLLRGRMEEVLSQPFSDLVGAAAAVNSTSVGTVYSDKSDASFPIQVYLGYYDAIDSDGDGDTFTIDDPNTDGDFNPYTGGEADIRTLWVRVEALGRGNAFETVTSR